MKKLFLNTLAFVALFGLMSNACEDLVEDIEVDVPVEIEKTFTVNVAEGDSVLVEKTEIINYPAELDEHNISSVEITELKVKVTTDENHDPTSVLELDVTFDEALSSGVIGFGFTFENMPQEENIDLSGTWINSLEDQIMEKEDLEVTYKGWKSGGPVSGTVTLKIKGIATGKPL